MLSIIIPTYNERETICPLIEAILQQVPSKILQEIIIIDDNSPDGTALLVEKKQYPYVKIVPRKEKGLVSAIATGIKLARGKQIMWFDADLYMIPAYITSMHEKLEQGYDAVIASRYVAGGADRRNVLRKYSSLYINSFAQFILKMPFTDYTSGIIMCNADKLKK